MRTTITLDDDVEKKVNDYMLKTGFSAKTVFNNLIRAALAVLPQKTPSNAKAFSLRVFKGKHGLMPGFSWDMTTADLLDKIDEEAMKSDD